jgi:hypothetical protein
MAMNSTNAILLSSLLWLTSCSKEEPGVHPSQQELTGTSRIVKIAPDDWHPNGTPGDEIYSYVASGRANNIDQAIVDHGIVRVQKQQSHGGWIDLPSTIEQDGVAQDWNFSYSLDHVTITIDRNGAEVIPPEEHTVFKVITVPQL